MFELQPEHFREGDFFLEFMALRDQILNDLDFITLTPFFDGVYIKVFGFSDKFRQLAK